MQSYSQHIKSEKWTVNFNCTVVQPLLLEHMGDCGKGLTINHLGEGGVVRIRKKMQLDVDIEPTFRFTYMKCTDKQKDTTSYKL